MARQTSPAAVFPFSLFLLTLLRLASSVSLLLGFGRKCTDDLYELLFVS